jgi:hypothetical protein
MPLQTRTKSSAVIAAIHAAAFCFTPASFSGTCSAPERVAEMAPRQVREFFAAKKLQVVTFFGYSDAGYEHHDGMLKQATRELEKADPRRTIVNIGATESGIGAVYKLAKDRGFKTSGIVSTQARDQKVALSPCVDLVFYIEDPSWGGNQPGTTTLSPTSDAIVTVSEVLIAIGGGEVARDELLAAKRMGKKVTFIPADMNHRRAREKAAGKGLPEPKDFRGAAHAALLPDA